MWNPLKNVSEDKPGWRNERKVLRQFPEQIRTKSLMVSVRSLVGARLFNNSSRWHLAENLIFPPPLTSWKDVPLFMKSTAMGEKKSLRARKNIPTMEAPMHSYMHDAHLEYRPVPNPNFIIGRTLRPKRSTVKYGSVSEFWGRNQISTGLSANGSDGNLITTIPLVIQF